MKKKKRSKSYKLVFNLLFTFHRDLKKIGKKEDFSLVFHFHFFKSRTRVSEIGE